MQRKYEAGPIRVFFRDQMEEEELPDTIWAASVKGLEFHLASVRRVSYQVTANPSGCDKKLHLELDVDDRKHVMEYSNEADIEGILDEFRIKGKPEQLHDKTLYALMYGNGCIGISKPETFKQRK